MMIGLGFGEFQWKFQCSWNHENKVVKILLDLPGLIYRQNGVFQFIIFFPHVLTMVSYF